MSSTGRQRVEFLCRRCAAAPSRSAWTLAVVNEDGTVGVLTGRMKQSSAAFAALGLRMMAIAGTPVDVADFVRPSGLSRVVKTGTVPRPSYTPITGRTQVRVTCPQQRCGRVVQVGARELRLRARASIGGVELI